VYSGRDRLGAIERHGDQYLARDTHNRPIGVFDSMIEAARAVGAAADEVAS
jgi:hypothetical protein